MDNSLHDKKSIQRLRNLAYTSHDEFEPGFRFRFT